MKKTVILALSMILPLLAACNTVEGFGEDMQRGGEKIEDKANESK